MSDTNKIDNYVIIRGLMRGDYNSLKLGYSASAAISMLGDIGQIENQNHKEILTAYAEGFADGMREDRARIYFAGP